MRRRNILLMTALLCSGLFWGCADNKKSVEMPYAGEGAGGGQERNAEDRENAEGMSGTAKTEKGYDLPVSDRERKEAEADGRRIMGLAADLYESAEKGSAPDSIFPEEALRELTERIGETGSPVRSNRVYSNMENYENMEKFLSDSAAGVNGKILVYEIHSDGSIGRYQYSFDGENMHVLAANFMRDSEGTPVMAYISHTRLAEWRYTEKGWFAYKLCVPEYPEVTEVVDGSCLIRIKPITEENREMSEKYVFGLGYRGNNLLCSDWDEDHLEALDYNGAYEYLYAMKYREEFPAEDYQTGIPKEEFEHLIMEYLPVTAEEIRSYAAFDGERQTYVWKGLAYSNHISAWFETSVPEVTEVKENDDGTVTLRVDAVCSMVLCDDAVITHELTVRLLADGGFQYLGNRVLNDGIREIPDYQYRAGEPCISASENLSGIPDYHKKQAEDQRTGQTEKSAEKTGGG